MLIFTENSGWKLFNRAERKQILLWFHVLCTLEMLQQCLHASRQDGEKAGIMTSHHGTNESIPAAAFQVYRNYWEETKPSMWGRKKHLLATEVLPASGLLSTGSVKSEHTDQKSRSRGKISLTETRINVFFLKIVLLLLQINIQKTENNLHGSVG